MRLFLYGTLIDGSDNPMARAVHRLLIPLGPATVRGSLFAVPDPQGWFPALIAGDGLVHGRLYEATDSLSPEELARLDVYEEFDPQDQAASLYVRVALPVTDETGAARTAEVYRYNRSLPTGSCAIASGDFRDWIVTRGETAFAGHRDAT